MLLNDVKYVVCMKLKAFNVFGKESFLNSLCTKYYFFVLQKNKSNILYVVFFLLMHHNFLFIWGK